MSRSCNYLYFAKNLPVMDCKGIRNKRITMPAKHDGPISCHSSPTTTAAWRGPTQRKCKKMVICWRECTVNKPENNMEVQDTTYQRL